MKKLLFCISDYKYLSKKILRNVNFEEGKIENKTFVDGELYQRILTPLENRSVYILGGTVNDRATLELYDLASSIASLGAKNLNLIVPYYGYSTMERAVKNQEVVKAKTRARLFSSIPRSHNGNKIFLFDLHAEGITHYFETPLFPTHKYCTDIINEIAKQYGGDDFVFASTDAGRAKWVESLANDCHVNAAFILKRRLADSQTEVSALNADVKNKTVVIYDDMIRSGNSAINAAKTYKDAGANKIFVITTHGLFLNDAVEKLTKTGVIEKIITLDTHPNAAKTKSPFIEVRSVDKIIAKLMMSPQ